MPSLIAWLDASAEEQRRMRDVIRLFADRESRDELGLGQIRDGISDILFPGSSTLLTRARYLLFVPWVYQLAARSSDPISKADRLERELIGAIKGSDDFAGLVGMQAGVTLKTLPSSIYWTMLRHYRILDDPSLSREDALRRDGARGLAHEDDATVARFRAWSATLPAAPDGFPGVVDGGFALTHGEATWMRDRILDVAPGSYLAHLTSIAPEHDSPSPWADPASISVDSELDAMLTHTRTFSAVMHGAQLLYNLMIAEDYERAGLDRVTDPVALYRSDLDDWAVRVGGTVDVAGWSLDDLITRVELDRGTPIHPSARRFVGQWLDIVKGAPLESLADDPYARRTIARRERQNKGAQARIDNPRRLGGWGGGSGAGELVFRWPTVRGILRDLHEGLGRKALIDA